MMDGIASAVLTVCVVLLATEMAGRFCPESDLLNFLRGLIFLLLTISLLSALLKFDWKPGFSNTAAPAAETELSEYVQEQMESAAQKELQENIRGLLAAVELQAKKIEIFTDRNEDSGIVLTKVKVTFLYRSEAERAEILLKNVLGEEIEVEVQSNGG